MSPTPFIRFLIIASWCTMFSLTSLTCLASQSLATSTSPNAAASTLPARALPLDGPALLQRVDDYRRYRDSGFAFDFDLVEQDGLHSLLRVSLKPGSTNTAISRYKLPVSARGRAVLSIGNTFWLYEPGMHSALRISPRQMLSGQASAGDITRITFAGMYQLQASHIGEATLNLHLLAIPGKGTSYDQIDLTIDAATFQPRQALCRGTSGTLMKTITYQTFQEIEGKTLLTGFSIHDATTGQSSAIKLGNFTASTLPDSAFQVQALAANP